MLLPCRAAWACMCLVCACAEQDRSIKLGLGDFVFYSVLVSRSALFDLSSMAASFIAIIMVRRARRVRRTSVAHTWDFHCRRVVPWL